MGFTEDQELLDGVERLDVIVTFRSSVGRLRKSAVIYSFSGYPKYQQILPAHTTEQLHRPSQCVFPVPNPLHHPHRQLFIEQQFVQRVRPPASNGGLFPRDQWTLEHPGSALVDPSLSGTGFAAGVVTHICSVGVVRGARFEDVWDADHVFPPAFVQDFNQWKVGSGERGQGRLRCERLRTAEDREARPGQQRVAGRCPVREGRPVVGEGGELTVSGDINDVPGLHTHRIIHIQQWLDLSVVNNGQRRNGHRLLT